MKKLALIPVILLACICAVTAQETVDVKMMQKIKDEEKNNSQIKIIAHNITDVCGPRLTNSRGYNCAIDWIAAFAKAGIAKCKS